MLFIIEWNIFMFAVDFLSYTVQGVTLGFEMYLFQNYRVPINVEKKIQLCNNIQILFCKPYF